MTKKDPTLHIAISGNIGSGKTTLTKQLSQHFGWTAHYEDVEQNPYLSDFYKDMLRWSFNLQVYFLNHRFNQIKHIQRGKNTVVQDRTIYEDAEIFAANLHHMGLMPKRDYDNYIGLFNTMESQLKSPDLLIYLRASIPTLLHQIQKRGRAYEANLREEYLKKLNEYYESWIKRYNKGALLIIDVEKYNFADKQKDLNQLVEVISKKLSLLKNNPINE